MMTRKEDKEKNKNNLKDNKQRKMLMKLQL